METKKEKVFYALKHVDGGFYGGDESKGINRYYYIYDEKIGNERLKNMMNPTKWDIIESPVQNEKIWY